MWHKNQIQAINLNMIWSSVKSYKRYFWDNWRNLNIDRIFWKYFKESNCGYVENYPPSQAMHDELCTGEMPRRGGGRKSGKILTSVGSIGRTRWL